MQRKIKLIYLDGDEFEDVGDFRNIAITNQMLNCNFFDTTGNCSDYELDIGFVDKLYIDDILIILN